MTYAKAKNALNTIFQPIGNGQTKKSDLAKAKGDIGLQAYHLKHDIQDAIKVLLEKEQDLRSEYVELDKKEKKSKKDEERIEELNNEFVELQSEEVEVKLTKGKFKIDDVKCFLDAIELEALEDFIQF